MEIESRSEAASNAYLNRSVLHNMYQDNMERQSPKRSSSKPGLAKSNSNGSKDELENKENAYVSFFNANN